MFTQKSAARFYIATRIHLQSASGKTDPRFSPNLQRDARQCPCRRGEFVLCYARYAPFGPLYRVGDVHKCNSRGIAKPTYLSTQRFQVDPFPGGFCSSSRFTCLTPTTRFFSRHGSTLTQRISSCLGCESVAKHKVGGAHTSNLRMRTKPVQDAKKRRLTMARSTESVLESLQSTRVPINGRQ